jgi:hypothetical protein
MLNKYEQEYLLAKLQMLVVELESTAKIAEIEKEKLLVPPMGGKMSLGAKKEYARQEGIIRGVNRALVDLKPIVADLKRNL